MNWSSARGNCWFENGSLCVHICRDDRPRERIREFNEEVAMAKVRGETTLPKGS